MKRSLALLAVSSVLLTATFASARPLQLGARHRARMAAQVVAQKADFVLQSVRFDRVNNSWRKSASLARVKRLDASAHRFLRILDSGNVFNLRPALMDLWLRFGEAKQSFPWLRHNAMAEMELNQVGRFIGELRGIVAQMIATATIPPPAPALTITPPPFDTRVVYQPYPPAPPPVTALNSIYTTPGASVSVYRNY